MTASPGFLKTVFIYISGSCIITKNTLLHSQKCYGLDNKLYDHLSNKKPLSSFKKQRAERLVQDGRVEGRVLAPSCKSTGTATDCWTVIDGKTLELTREDTPHPGTKERPRWDGRRGAITIKSSPTTAGWVAHKVENTYTTEVHPVE